MRPSQNCLDIIMEFEGYHTKLKNGDCKAYLDKLVRAELRSPGYAGLWTIGWGSTGRDVTEGTVWTREQAAARLQKVVDAHARQVDKAITVPVTQSMFDALVSSSYNIHGGIKAMKTLLARLNRGDYEGAADAILLYDSAGGRKVRGLTRRRQAERKLFLSEGLSPKQERKLVVDHSHKLLWMQRLRNFIAGLGVTGYFTWDNLGQAKALATDNLGLVLLSLGVAAWVVFKWFEHRAVTDYKDGRYTPSGLATVEEADNV